MDAMKVILNNLIRQNIIYDLNKGKVDKESFKIVVVEEKSVVENPDAESNVQLGVNEKTAALELFINDKFHNTLINLIKEEVKTAVKSEITSLSANSNVHNVNVISSESNNAKRQLRLNRFIDWSKWILKTRTKI